MLWPTVAVAPLDPTVAEGLVMLPEDAPGALRSFRANFLLPSLSFSTSLPLSSPGLKVWLVAYLFAVLDLFF